MKSLLSVFILTISILGQVSCGSSGIYIDPDASNQLCFVRFKSNQKIASPLLSANLDDETYHNCKTLPSVKASPSTLASPTFATKTLGITFEQLESVWTTEIYPYKYDPATSSFSCQEGFKVSDEELMCIPNEVTIIRNDLMPSMAIYDPIENYPCTEFDQNGICTNLKEGFKQIGYTFLKDISLCDKGYSVMNFICVPNYYIPNCLYALLPRQDQPWQYYCLVCQDGSFLNQGQGTCIPQDEDSDETQIQIENVSEVEDQYDMKLIVTLIEVSLVSALILIWTYAIIVALFRMIQLKKNREQQNVEMEAEVEKGFQ